jgi:hypothetical protein
MQFGDGEVSEFPTASFESQPSPYHHSYLPYHFYPIIFKCRAPSLQPTSSSGTMEPLVGKRTRESPIVLDDDDDAIASKYMKPAANDPGSTTGSTLLTLLPFTDDTCAICLDTPTSMKDVATISGCTHKFCFGCIVRWAATENSCPCCKARFRTIDRFVPDLSLMSLAELQQRKRELKQQLKLYDMNFSQQHDRMPEEREKEPIRHLYESYNAYKNQISVIEKGEAQPGPSTAAFRGVSNAIPTNVALMQQNASSPIVNSGNTSPRDIEYRRRSSSGNMSEISAGENDAEEADSPPDNSMVSQDLASLKAEKATLQQMLRSYEKDFYRQHNRQVSSFADIRPMAQQYLRYSEIKKEIARKSSSN